MEESDTYAEKAQKYALYRKEKRERYAAMKVENPEQHQISRRRKYERSRKIFQNLTPEERAAKKAERNFKVKLQRQKMKRETGFISNYQKKIHDLRGLVKSGQANEEQMKKYETIKASKHKSTKGNSKRKFGR